VLAFLGTGAIEPLVMFVSALGSWLPTMGGVMIAHFYVVERRKRKIEAKGLAGIISWVTISLLVQLGIMPYAGIMGIVGAFLLYLVLYYGIEKPIFGEKVIG
jgi:purine-cytosine permease-like protein